MKETQEGRRRKKRRMKEDTWRKTQEDFFRKIFTSHFIARVRKGCSRFACERVLETEDELHILTPLLWPSRCVFLVVLDAQPEVLGSTPSGLFRGPPRSGVAFPTTSGLYCLEVCWQLLWHPNSTELNNNSTPTRSPTGCLNRMFNRHQAEITAMQFRGYSLPVHHCNGTIGPSPCPISYLNPPTRSLPITGRWNVSLPSGVLPWNSIFGPGRRSKYNNLRYKWMTLTRSHDQTLGLVWLQLLKQSTLALNCYESHFYGRHFGINDEVIFTME